MFGNRVQGLKTYNKIDLHTKLYFAVLGMHIQPDSQTKMPSYFIDYWLSSRDAPINWYQNRQADNIDNLQINRYW